MSSSPTPHILAHCPLCQAAYEEESVRMLAEPSGLAAGRSGTRTFHLTCKQCRHAVLAVIMESGHGVSSIGLVTDLEAEDAVRMQDVDAISADDVVRAHLELDQKSAEMCRVLLKEGM